MTAAVAGLMGLLIGSFLNVCIYRMPRDLSVVHPRSFCPHCQAQIAWYDNVPLLSWIILRGRCRRCAAPIPFRYPLVELLTGISFALGALLFGATPGALKFCVFAAIQIMLIFADLEERILPDEFTLGGLLAGLVLAWFVPPQFGLATLFLPEDMNLRLAAVIESAVSAVVPALALWTVGALYHRFRGREGLGFGDVKMVACIGAFLGMGPALLALAGGSLLGTLVGLSYIAVSRKDHRTYELPFGSFLGIAAVLTALLRLDPDVL